MSVLSEYIFTFEFCRVVIAIFNLKDWLRYGAGNKFARNTVNNLLNIIFHKNKNYKFCAITSRSRA